MPVLELLSKWAVLHDSSTPPFLRALGSCQSRMPMLGAKDMPHLPTCPAPQITPPSSYLLISPGPFPPSSPELPARWVVGGCSTEARKRMMTMLQLMRGRRLTRTARSTGSSTSVAAKSVPHGFNRSLLELPRPAAAPPAQAIQCCIPNRPPPIHTYLSHTSSNATGISRVFRVTNFGT